jgi:hypothetical protein
MRYTNDAAWELVEDLDLPWPDAETADRLAPLVDAIRAGRPTAEVEKLSRKLAPGAWSDSLADAVRLELQITRVELRRDLESLDHALDDLANRGARGMTARAVLDHFALVLADAGLESMPEDPVG